MVPMRVRNEDVGGDGQLPQERKRKRKDAGAGVEHNQRVVIGANFDGNFTADSVRLADSANRDLHVG